MTDSSLVINRPGFRVTLQPVSGLDQPQTLVKVIPIHTTLDGGSPVGLFGGVMTGRHLPRLLAAISDAAIALYPEVARPARELIGCLERQGLL